MSRRAIGEGTVYQRPDGKWIGEATIGWDGGKRRRRRVVTETQREARARLRRIQDAIRDSAPIAADRLTVAQWLNEWLEKEARPRVRPRTFDGYRTIVVHHLAPYFAKVKLRDLEPRHVRDYLATKATQGSRKELLSAQTLHHHHAVLRRALQVAESYGYVQRNVAKLASPPTIHRPEVAPLTPEQSTKFLAAIAGMRDEHLYHVAMATGLRQSELLGLRWEDVDFEGATLSVRTTLQRYGGAYHLDPPKTSRSARTLALPAPIAAALRAQRRRQRVERVAAGPTWQGGRWGLVFTTGHGTPMSGSDLTKRFQAALSRAALPRVRFHDLRHGAATYLLAAGVDLRVVMEIMGHSTITTTANTYAHVLPRLQREAADRLGAMLFPAAMAP